MKDRDIAHATLMKKIQQLSKLRNFLLYFSFIPAIRRNLKKIDSKIDNLSLDIYHLYNPYKDDSISQLLKHANELYAKGIALLEEEND